MDKYEQLISKLAEKECLTCGGKEKPINECICDAKGKMSHWFDTPILIGDVLEKMNPKEKISQKEVLESFVKRSDLMAVWQPCGFTKSLQEIAEMLDVTVVGEIADDAIRELKPEASQLFDFIIELKLKDK